MGLAHFGRYRVAQLLALQRELSQLRTLPRRAHVARSPIHRIAEFASWAWSRHHNPLSWYVRPLFVLPLCYFAYRKSRIGIAITVLAVASSIFWFAAPEDSNQRIASFLAIERAWVGGAWTLGKIAMTALVPCWFIALVLAFWRRSWPVGFFVINLGAALKVSWSFYVAGDSAWSIIAPVALGLVVCNGFLFLAYRKAARRRSDSNVVLASN